MRKVSLFMGVMCFFLGFAWASSTPVDDFLERARSFNGPVQARELASQIQRHFAQLVQPEQLAATCAQLQPLSGTDLRLFEDVLTDEGSQLPCRGELLERLDRTYHFERTELARTFGVPSQGSVIMRDRRTGPCQTQLTGPDLVIDPTGGPAIGGYTTLRDALPRIRRLPDLRPGEVVLTFDDGPAGERTQQILETLDAYCVRATFFLVGRSLRARSAGDVVASIIRGGHTIANHTVDHPYFRAGALTEAEQLAQITGFDRELAALVGRLRAQQPDIEPLIPTALTRFFRFPGGIESLYAINFLQAWHRPSFTWDASADDWMPQLSAQDRLMRGMDQLRRSRGGIFLLHDLHQGTVDMLPYLLEQMMREGFTVRAMVQAPNLALPRLF